MIFAVSLSNYCNTAAVIMELTGLISQGLVGFVNAVLIPVVGSAFGDAFRKLITAIVKAIPL